MLLLWSVACPVSVSGREERGSKPDRPEFWETLLVLFWVQKEKPSTMSFAVGSGPQTLFTLVGRRSLGKGVAGLVKRTRATGAKVGGHLLLLSLG